MPISPAEKMGFQKVWGVVLPKNRSIRALNKKLGFQMNQYPGAEQEIERVISLDSFDGSLK
jgi:hypothetical protein